MAPVVSYRTYNDAVKALLRLRKSGQLEGMVARIITSSYGGYRIKKTPADIYVETTERRRAL